MRKRSLFIVLLVFILVLLSSCGKTSTSSVNVDYASTSSDSVNYVFNKRSHKFHYPYCKSVDDMAEHNKLFWTGDRESLIKLYPDASPCRNCNP